MKLFHLQKPKNFLARMPPTRGHDLKHGSRGVYSHGSGMPPTRGHDLKQWQSCKGADHCAMPPTRGHDLKPTPRMAHMRAAS